MNDTNAEEESARASGPSIISAEVDDVDRRIRQFGEQHPLLALGMVVAAGYLVGRIVSRL